MREPGIFEVMYSCRAMRRLKPNPVPPELIHRVLEAGTQAPSGSNRQPWAFVVVTDPALKARLAPLYRQVCDGYVATARRAFTERYGAPPPKQARQLDATAYLAEHLAETPVLLFVYVREYKPQVEPGNGPAGSVFPAIQNILLACRALGLGATLTSFLCAFRAELRDLLGVPADYAPVATIPIGWPHGNFGPVSRRPVREVAHLNRWGAPFAPAADPSA